MAALLILHRAHEAFKKIGSSPICLPYAIFLQRKSSISCLIVMQKGQTTRIQISVLLQDQLIVTTSSMYMTTFKHYSSLMDTAFRDRE